MPLHPTLPDEAVPANTQELTWIILKFGGTSVSSKSRWDTIVELAAKRLAARHRVVIVVSALSGVTDQLKALCEAFNDEACTEVLSCWIGFVWIHGGRQIILPGKPVF